METIVEIILSFLAVVGLVSLGWLGFGWLLLPAGDPGAVCLLPGRGEGETLEQAVTGLVWLQGGGLFGGRLVIVDCGLTENGRAVARALTRRESSVELCPVEELEQYIRAEARR